MRFMRTAYNAKNVSVRLNNTTYCGSNTVKIGYMQRHIFQMALEETVAQAVQLHEIICHKLDVSRV